MKKGGPTPSYGCSNIGFPCGKTGICVCRLTKSSQQICSNGVVPPNGISFQVCQSSANCPSNQVWDLLNSICVNKCQTN